MKSLVIKLSSALIVQEHRDDWLERLALHIERLQKDGYAVCLVVSGAVAVSRHAFGKSLPENHQLYGILGQPLLFSAYHDALKKRGIRTAQMLVTKDDFRSRRHYLKIRDALDELLSHAIVPLINENDAVRFGGQSFSDNDEIAGLVTSLLGAERLVIASTVEGLLDDNGTIVEEIAFGDSTWRPLIRRELSRHGRGGMELKCVAAERLAQRGIGTTICSGYDPNTLYRAATGHAVGTHFAAERHLSAKKRWLLDHASFAEGGVKLDKKAAEIMKSSHAASLLMVGVTAVTGPFKKGDVIAVRDTDENVIGYGQSRISSDRATGFIGDRTKHILIHYDEYMGVL